MKVILNQDIPHLGEEGDIKTVANGYARNYLLPRKLVMPYTKQNLLILESRRNKIEKKKTEKRESAGNLKERLEAEELVFIMPAGEKGKLFGSVNNTLIAEELEKKGFRIEKKKIEIPEGSIRNVGKFEIKIRLYEQKEAVVNVVVKSQGEEKAAQERAESTGMVTEKAETAVTATEEVAPETTVTATEEVAPETETAATEEETPVIENEAVDEEDAGEPEETYEEPETTGITVADEESDTSDLPDKKGETDKE